MNVLLCPLSDAGYLYPVIAVGRELRDRGHKVSLIARAPVAVVAAEAGLPLLAAGCYGGRRAFNVVRWAREGRGQYQAVLRAARDARPDVLVTSVLCHGPLLAAEALDLPVVVLGLSAHLWDYQADGERPWLPGLRAWRSRVILRCYTRSREQAGFPSVPDGADRLPGTVLLLRGDPVLEDPGAVLGDRIQHVGPCPWEPAADPAELDAITARLDQIGKPVVYVHLGRVFGGPDPWPRLNATFTGSAFQAVVEQGRTADPQPASGADLLVVHKPWMGPLISRAGLVLTSGTSAPVLGALRHGRPIGVSPAGSEQPLLAHASVRAGVAVDVPERESPDPAAVIRTAWQDERLRARALELGQRLNGARSTQRAADVIQRVGTARPATGQQTARRALAESHQADLASTGS